jgi:PRC-barrel domain
MAAFDPATLDRWRALAIVDRDGSTVGTISEFYLDRETGHPTWALVNTGLFGVTQTFVPLVHTTEISDGLQVPYDKRHIKDTPKVDLHDELTPEEEATLFAHYGVDYQPLPPGNGEPGPAGGEAATVVEGEPGSAVDDGEPGTVVPGAEPGSVADDGEPRAVVPGAEPGSDERPAVVDAEPGPAGASAAGATEPRPPEGPGPVPAAPETVEAAGAGAEPRSAAPDATDEVPDEPGTEATHGERSRSDPDGPGGRFPDEPGTTSPEDPTPVGSVEAADPGVGRTAPVASGLPGSTAASPYGPGPATTDKDADSSRLPAEDPYRSPDEPVWVPSSAGSLEEHEPTDGPTAADDRWQEPRPAAERDRIAPAADTHPEERSPFERARRRLERLVGGGQDRTDPEGISPADRDAAERARRARLGLDEEDDRGR